MAQTPAGRIFRYALTRKANPLPDSPENVLRLFHAAVDEIEAELVGHFQTAKRSGADPSNARDMTRGMSWLFQFLLEFLLLTTADARDFPNLVRYTHYLKQYDSVVMTKAVSEMHFLRVKIEAELLKTDEDRSFAQFVPRLRLLEGVGSLACLPGDVKLLAARFREFNHGRLCAEFDRLVSGSAALEEEYEDRIENSLRYYRLMDLRADAMARNTIARMCEFGVLSCVLLTGGFHRDRIAATLASLGIGYTGIFPLITKPTTGPETDEYFRQLSSQKLDPQ